MKIKSPIGPCCLLSALGVSAAALGAPPSIPQSLVVRTDIAWHPAICISDFTGDGVPDCVLAIPGKATEGAVAIYDGATGDWLRP
jgi:hypothetical protein